MVLLSLGSFNERLNIPNDLRGDNVRAVSCAVTNDS